MKTLKSLHARILMLFRAPYSKNAGPKRKHMSRATKEPWFVYILCLNATLRNAHLFKVSEKCPSCGNLEAYSKEMQVR